MELRHVAKNMIPVTLHTNGISDAIKTHCESIKTSSKIAVNYSFSGANNRLDLGFELTVFRMAKELIGNSIKHSFATSINVRLTLSKEILHLSVSDNGLGFDVTQLSQSEGRGIANIRLRTAALNGKFKIKSDICSGTSVSVEFSNPLNITSRD
jgi:signal transduction histidine kinase